MALNYNIQNLSFHLPWFMYDIDNKQLITTVTIPGTITIEKDVILSETPIPGKNHQPIFYGGGGNKKLSFTLPIMKRNNSIGNVAILKQFENLTNQASGLTNIFTSQFTRNPKVLYFWGTGSLPLVYYVKKCNLANQENWINALGNPQYTFVDIELWLDESNPIYKIEEVFRKMTSLSASILNSYEVHQSIYGFKRGVL